jgi:signal transduction histidine kinase
LSSALQGVILREQREKAEEQILEYQKNLEKLVGERTMDLLRANKELEGKNAELEQFAYTVSHDLKAPLVTIKGFLGFIREDVNTGNDIARISDAADRMNSLLSDLLELSRIGRMMNEPETIPFADLVNDAAKLVEGRLQKSRVLLKVNAKLPVVRGDRQRLLEVVQNLLDNAAKFMGPQVEPQIEVGARGSEDEMPILYVRDNGVGIPLEFQARIFGLFNRLNPEIEGTGVGLALVKRIVEFHGGRIWVESEAGRGTTFLFTLPSPKETG